MLTRIVSWAESLIRARPRYAYTESPPELPLINGTGATVAVGDLLMVDFSSAGINSTTFEYTTAIFPTTAALTPTLGAVFCVAESVSAIGGTVMCRFEGDTLLKVTSGNAAVNTLLMGINAASGAATATTGLLVIARSKESGTGLKRVYFKGTGICTSA